MSIFGHGRHSQLSPAEREDQQIWMDLLGTELELEREREIALRFRAPSDLDMEQPPIVIMDGFLFDNIITSMNADPTDDKTVG